MTAVLYQDRLDQLETDGRIVALRAELEETRAAFHALLVAVARTRWQEKCVSSEWTIGEMCLHLTWALEQLPQEVQAARRGQGMFNYPKRVGETLSYWYVRWLARSVTPDSVALRYDKAMDATIQMLDTLPEDAWPLGADFYGEGFHSVEDLLHGPARHFAEHTAGLAFEVAGVQRNSA
jgi:hypothetical protein